MCKKVFLSIAILIFSMARAFTGTAEAQLRPSSAVLLPYFEVDLGSSGKATMFAVGNVLNQPVDIQIEMRTNWGIRGLGRDSHAGQPAAGSALGRLPAGRSGPRHLHG